MSPQRQSIRYKDESRLLDVAEDVDAVYIEKVLPAKMEWNLKSLRQFGLFRGAVYLYSNHICGNGKGLYIEGYMEGYKKNKILDGISFLF